MRRRELPPIILMIIVMATTMVAGTTMRASAAAPDKACAARDGGLEVSRVIEIDTAAGPLYGDITKFTKEKSFLKPKEILLTFDDGPMPWVTGSILDTLDRFCTKATFFSVGKMAIAYPKTLRDIVARGHTLGAHTWSHPLNLKKLKFDKAMDEIERGFAAVSLASGGNAAPFFRFPGLSDNNAMLEALQKRGIASFTVDVVSNDSYISNPAKLVAMTLARVEARRGGILLFHDIKPATAKALPVILGELRRRGYKVVHMRSKEPVKPLPDIAKELHPVLAKKDPPQGGAVAKAAMLPFFGAVGPEKVVPASASDDGAVVESLVPPPRDRTASKPAVAKSENSDKVAATAEAKPNSKTRKLGETANLRNSVTPPDSWSTRVRRERLNKTFFD